VSCSKAFSSCGLIFFNRHVRIAKPYQLHRTALFRQDREFFVFTGGTLRFIIPGKPLASVVNAHVFMIKLMGCALRTADPEAALALTAVPRENPEPTPTGKYVL